jgi:hypothetical protein
MRVTQTRPRFNVPSERREHHQPQVIGRLIREKMSLPSPGLEPGSPALESSVLTTPPLARSYRIVISLSVGLSPLSIVHVVGLCGVCEESLLYIIGLRCKYCVI